MGTRLSYAAVVAAMLLNFEASAADSNSGAYGARVDLRANIQVIGLGAGTAVLARTPEVNGNGASSYGPFSQTVLGASVGLLGTTVFTAGVLSARTEHDSAAPLTSSRGYVEDAEVNLQVTPLLPLLGLTADSIEANARISGVCGNLSASGSSQLLDARVTALGGGLLNLPVNPPPNFTVGLGALGIAGVTLILNEQIVSGNANQRSITVNALRLDVSANALLATLSGDIVIGHARAQRSCAAGDGPNLLGTKSASPSPATVGQPLTFTLSAQNVGNQTASSVQLVDTLHPSFTVQSVSSGPGGSCSRSGQTVTCTYAALAPGASATATVVVIPAQAGTFANTLNSGFDGPDVDPGNDDPSIDVVVNPAQVVADVDVQLSANPIPATVGTDVIVQVTVRNTGPDSSTVNLQQLLVGSFNLVAVLPSGNGQCSGTTPVNCSWTGLASAATETVSIRLLPQLPGNIAATATVSVPAGVSDPDPTDNTASLNIPVNAAQTVADLSVVKSAAPLPATVGQALTFTLTVSNAGPDAAGASVTDVLPPSLSLQSANASGGGSCTGSSTVVCTWPSIAAGASRVATLVTIPNAAGTLSNTATVTSTTGSTDPDGGDDSSTIVVPVNPTATADLSVVKSATPNPATVGQPLTFTLNVANAGPDASGASVSDALPAGVTLQSSSASGGGVCSGTSTVVCSWTSIGAGQNRTATLVVIPTVSGQLSNTAIITPTGGVSDPDNDDDSSTIVVPVNPAAASADLALGMTASPNPVTVGQALVYTLTVSNAGPDASAAQLSNPLSASVDLQSAIANGGGSCTGGSPVVCTWAAIPAGSSRTATVTVRPNVVGALGNSATVISVDGSVDPNPANNSASAQVQVQNDTAPASADLSVTQSATPQPAVAGQSLSVSLTINNAGPSASPVTLSNQINSNFSVQSVNASNGGVCTSSNVLSCNWSSVPAGASVSVLVSLLPSAPGSFANTVNVSTSAGVVDPDSSNNSSTRSLLVDPAQTPAPSADLSVVVRALPATVTVGNTLRLQAEVRNGGPGVAAATLNQALNPAFALISVVNPPGVSCSGTVQISCAIPGLASGSNTTVELEVRAVRSGNILHQASVAAVAPALDPDGSNNSGSTSIVVSAATTPANSDLSISKAAFPMDPVVGAPVDFVLSVRNHGPDAAAGPIVVIDELPSTLVAESVTAQGGGNCTLSAGIVRCTWDSLASGTAVSASILARASVTGPVRNVAVVNHPNTDGDPGNDEAEVTVDVRPQDGLRSDGGQCRVVRKLTDHDQTDFLANAELRYGGSEVIYADQLGNSAGTFVESLALGSDKATMMAHSGTNTQLLLASRSGARAVVRSGLNLAEDGAPLAAPRLFLLDLSTQRAQLLPEEIGDRLAIDGSAEELYYFKAASDTQTDLQLYRAGDGSVETLQSFVGAIGLFDVPRLSPSGRQLAFTANINPLGLNNDGSKEVFRYSVAEELMTQVSAGVQNNVALGGFDGSGERLSWIAAGQVHVHDSVSGTRQLSLDGMPKRDVLLTHNGRSVVYLAEAGNTAGSLELVMLDVDGLSAAQVLTQLDEAGSDDRLLSHDGAGQTFLLASKRALTRDESSGNGREHLYVIDCDAVRSGAWFNPQRSGQGYAISRSRDGLAVVWYTYRADGTPTWYIASGPRQGKSWQAELLDVRYNAVDGSRTLSTVGTLTLTFADAHNAMAHWTLNGFTGFEPIQFLAFDRRPPARDDTGLWFDPQNPGWGMSISHQGQTRFMLTYLYDQSGAPLWVEGQTNLDAVQTPARLYFGPGLCSTSCAETGPAPLSSTVGQFTVEVQDYASLLISTDYRRGGDQAIDWLRATRQFVPLTPLSP